MKTKYTAVITVVVLGLAAALFAADRPNDTPLTLIRLKANGATVGELKLPKSIDFTFSSSESTQDKATGRVTAKGAVEIQFKHAAGPITIKADEIEITPAGR